MRHIPKRESIPIALTILIAGIWLIYLPVFYKDFVEKFYYMPFLGVIAATVANTTPAAAGIVYFPVLTRLQVMPVSAVQFNLMIQAYGMGLGTLKWYFFNKSLFILKVIPVCLIGGMVGVYFSIVIFPIQNPGVLMLFFNFFAFLLTQIIFISILFKKQYPNITFALTLRNIIVLLFFSLVGGLITGWIGFGIDTLFYFILTVFYHINPAIAIITSISLMASLSVFGTILNSIFYQLPFSIWFAAIPGVTIAGLFLASYIAVRIGAKNVLLLFTLLLSLDFLMSFWHQQSIQMDQIIRNFVLYGLVIYLVYIHIRIFKVSYENVRASLGDFKPEL